MYVPAEVFCIQLYLADEMAERGWKTEDVAARMKTSRGAAMDLLCIDIIMCIPDEKLRIEDDFFDGLGRAFDVSPEMFKNMHATWLAHPTKRVPFDVPDDLFGPASRRAMMRIVR
jgi:plasmid maintenance system antidote protein VapI